MLRRPTRKPRGELPDGTAVLPTCRFVAPALDIRQRARASVLPSAREMSTDSREANASATRSMWPTLASGLLAVTLAIPIEIRSTRISYYETSQNLCVALGLDVARLALVTIVFAALVHALVRMPSVPAGRSWWGWFAAATVLTGQWLHVAGRVALLGVTWPRVTGRVAVGGLLAEGYVMGGIALVAALLWVPSVARAVRERDRAGWAEVIVHLAWCLIAASMAKSSSAWSFYLL